jgi:hypothetical protein
MRSFLLLFSLLLATYCYAFGQTIITNTYFPKSGDTLVTSSIQGVKNFKIEDDGLSKTWDFTALLAKTVAKTYITEAKNGKNTASFPTATLVEKRLASGDEYYIKANTTTYETVGYAGVDATGLGVGAVTKVNPAAVNRRAPMKLLQLNNTNSALSVGIPLSALPDSIKSQLGQLATLVDSLRVKYVSTRTDIVDGYGKVKLPMGTYDVLREKRIQYNDKKLEVKTKIFGTWSDITSLIPAGQLPPQIKTFIGVDTSFQYHFFNGTQKEAILVATMDNKDNTKVNNVSYKNVVKYTTPTFDLGDNPNARPEIRAYPNPANEEVNIELTNFSAGTYTVKIYNLLGSILMQESHGVIGTKTIKLNIEVLRKGSYFYSISNSQGKIIATKRFMVLKA